MKKRDVQPVAPLSPKELEQMRARWARFACKCYPIGALKAAYVDVPRLLATIDAVAGVSAAQKPTPGTFGDIIGSLGEFTKS